MDRTVERTPAEVVEIERHKYLLSEKAGYDVGWEFAEKDWEDNYAANFRATECCDQDQPDENGCCGVPQNRGGLRMLLHRMFGKKN